MVMPWTVIMKNYKDLPIDHHVIRHPLYNIPFFAYVRQDLF